MPTTILLKGEKSDREFVVGAFYSRDKKILNYCWYAETSDELRHKIFRNSIEKPAYFVRVIPRNDRSSLSLL